ncbi:MAG TPA: di-heme oxidoredictase family protein, partial [Usitatibacter sp.]|nr:di-heme oxidoredictase family protein [Usitatibacter sp.]
MYSDLLVHDMGPGLADGVTQGEAGPSEFRTAPLWGLGQRVFFLHDGR